MIIGLHHVALGVTRDEFDAAVEFYTATLGGTIEFTSQLTKRPDADAVIGIAGVEARIAMVRLGGARVEIWAYDSPAPTERCRDANALGYPHIALAVTDIEAEHRRLGEAGMTFVGPPVQVGASRAVYGRDPFGNLIELYQGS